MLEQGDFSVFSSQGTFHSNTPPDPGVGYTWKLHPLNTVKDAAGVDACLQMVVS